MFAIKYLLLTTAIAMFLVAAAIVVYDVWLAQRYRRARATDAEAVPPEPLRWRTSVAFAALAWLPMLIALSIAIVPSGHAGVRVSELSGVKSGTLYPGAHAVVPLSRASRCSTSATSCSRRAPWMGSRRKARNR